MYIKVEDFLLRIITTLSIQRLTTGIHHYNIMKARRKSRCKICGKCEKISITFISWSLDISLSKYIHRHNIEAVYPFLRTRQNNVSSTSPLNTLASATGICSTKTGDRIKWSILTYSRSNNMFALLRIEQVMWCQWRAIFLVVPMDYSLGLICHDIK